MDADWFPLLMGAINAEIRRLSFRAIGGTADGPAIENSRDGIAIAEGLGEGIASVAIGAVRTVEADCRSRFGPLLRRGE